MIPRAKHKSFTEEYIFMTYEFSLCGNSGFENDAVWILNRFFSRCSVTVENDGFLKLKKTGNSAEKYRIDIKKDSVELSFSDFLGLRNALSAFSQLAKSKPEGFLLPVGCVEDYPEYNHRGVMIDLARGVRDFSELKRDIIVVSKARMNYLHLHLADSKGVCFKMESLPDEMCIENAYTKEQMKELVSFSKALGLEIIPEFDMPAHAVALIKNFPELMCDVPGMDKEKISKWAVCAGNDETYSLYEKIIAEISEVFDGKYFHMGGDELEFGDARHWNNLCHWSECAKCNALCEKEGIEDRERLYYYFVNRIEQIAKQYNKKLIMWSEQIDAVKPSGISREVLMQFWRVAAKNRGPSAGSTLDNQIDMWYNIINSYYLETYIDIPLYMNARAFEHWEINKQKTDKIIGSEVVAWEYGNPKNKTKYDRGFTPAVYLMADKLWNADYIEYDEEYSKKLTDAVLGNATPEGLDVYNCLNDLIPNKTEISEFIPAISISLDEVKKAAEVLGNEEYFYGDDLKRSLVYKELLQGIYNTFIPLEKAEK